MREREREVKRKNEEERERKGVGVNVRRVGEVGRATKLVSLAGAADSGR